MSTIPKDEVIEIATMSNGLQIWKLPNKEVGGFIYYSEENGAPLPALVEALISIECLEIILNDMKKTQGQLATDGREELEKENVTVEYWQKLYGEAHQLLFDANTTITALQSQCTEKEKELQGSISIANKSMAQLGEAEGLWKNQMVANLKLNTELNQLNEQNISQSKQIEELKAENERLKKKLRAIL